MRDRFRIPLYICASLAVLGLTLGQVRHPSVAGQERARSPFEDVVTIYAGKDLSLPDPQTQAWKVMLDGAHYPPGTVFSLEICMHLVGSSYTASLVDCASGQAISGSEVSLTSAGEEFLHGLSLEFSLPAGANLYQVRVDGGGTGWLDAARVRAVWSEEPVPTEKQTFGGLKSRFGKE